VSGGSGRALARFHLSPGVEGSVIPDLGAGGSCGSLRSGALSIACRTSSIARLKASEWHPEFGQTIATCCIEVPFASDSIETVLNWQMHVLFLTDNFPPEVNAPASRHAEHGKEWVRRGQRVTAII